MAAERVDSEVPGGMDFIPFNRPNFVGTEFTYLAEAIRNRHISAAGVFSRKCQELLESRIGSKRVLLTQSCTAALEAAAILADVGPGDEILMPSFTFVSTANAFVLRGATPVFVDVRHDTLNLDVRALETEITPRTRAIVPVHYAGVGCEMDYLLALAKAHGLLVIEDAAQGILSSFQERPLGSFGEMGTLSFHETKNVTCGEGGALLVNDEALVERSELVCEKGTNRRAFFRGQVDKYTWVELGSSSLMSEIAAAFLYAQLAEAESITTNRLATWNRYHLALAPLEAHGLLRRPVIPPGCRHNAHLYYVLVRDLATRSHVLSQMNRDGINAVFHYVPLHSSPAGKRYGRASSPLPVTQDASERLVRLPLWAGMSESDTQRVVGSLERALQ